MNLHAEAVARVDELEEQGEAGGVGGLGAEQGGAEGGGEVGETAPGEGAGGDEAFAVGVGGDFPGLGADRRGTGAGVVRRDAGAAPDVVLVDWGEEQRRLDGFHEGAVYHPVYGLQTPERCAGKYVRFL